ncbi:hypothetical protein [Kitasatospora cinereorecta]|uniref:DUF402 domain-containing protein n=1 Tax=Kitasatospora cinereorecta TaxID=285560 RepID=A0ABW0V7K0_9ACTN
MDETTGGADGGACGEVPYRTGDVLRMECPFTSAAVTAVGRYHVAVRWPWWEVDTEARGIEWNGDIALPTPADHGWTDSYFRTVPPEEELRAGDRCLVGIAPTVVHVLAVDHFDPPLETGWLPRPAAYIEFLLQGQSFDPELEEQGHTVDPAGGEPVRFALLFRPYAFLENGDDLVDHDGRAWRFDGPWDWHPYDGGPADAPAWPLHLLHRDGDPAPDEIAAVAAATATGSHADVAARWAELTHASPLPTRN